jgi:hypothetical protein
MVKKKKRSVHTAHSALVIHLLKEEKWELGIVEVVGVVTEVRGPMGYINCC